MANPDKTEMEKVFLRLRSIPANKVIVHNTWLIINVHDKKKFE